MDFDIDFWNEETEKDFYRFRNVLVEHSEMDTIQATHFLESIYSSVAREYGDQGVNMEEAKTDTTYCLKTCNKECWRKASKYVFKGGENYSFTNECIVNRCEQN